MGKIMTSHCNIIQHYTPLHFSKITTTVIVARMSHWKWRETKLQPSRARSGHHISCCLVSLHFLCDILAMITVHVCSKKSLFLSGLACFAYV